MLVPKLIVTDLDLTLLRTDKSISEYTLEIFKRCDECGIPTAIATARYYIGAEIYINLLNPEYAITTDGTMTYQKGKLICSNGFDLTTTNKFIQEIKNVNPQFELSVATEKCVYWNNECISESAILNKAIYNDYSDLLSNCAYKIVVELPDKSIADSIAEKYDCKVISYRGENRYGFINKNAGKIEAINALAGFLKIQMSDIVAFGDDLNDIEMLKQCGYGVAVLNAVDEVKKIADFVTENNDNDGVAKFISRNILR